LSFIELMASADFKKYNRPFLLSSC
jgi:hypothetical protein